MLLLTTIALASEPEPLPPLPPKPVLAVPFGAPQFAFQRPGWGATHASVQALSIASVVVSSRLMIQAAEDEDLQAMVLWRGVGLGSFTTLAVSYFTSTLMGSRDYQIRAFLLSEQSQARADAAMDFQQRRAYADELAVR